jgi:mannose-1-phosphate guanylyltransferase
MQAVILAGGEGTRLRPLTLTIPKPAIQLVDRPFLRHMLDWLSRHGADDVVIASGFGAEALREALEGGADPGVRTAYIQEREPLGTAGPLRLAADEGALDERFLVMNGDILADLDLGALIRAHAASGAVATLALYPVDDPSAYGLVRTHDDGQVAEFVEKPEPGEIDTNEISAGAYVLEREVLDLIPAGRMVSIEREVFPRLVGHGLYGHALDGYWMDIGTPERYLQASWDILEGRVRTEVGGGLDGGGPWIGADVTIGAEPSIGDRAVIASGSVLGDGVVVESSVVLAGSRIGPGATVSGSILAPGVQIGEGASIGPDAVIGEGAQVDAGAELGAGARLAPGELVP